MCAGEIAQLLAQIELTILLVDGGVRQVLVDGVAVLLTVAGREIGVPHLGCDLGRGRGHNLHQADSTLARDGVRVVGALLPLHGLAQHGELRGRAQPAGIVAQLAQDAARVLFEQLVQHRNLGGVLPVAQQLVLLGGRQARVVDQTAALLEVRVVGVWVHRDGDGRLIGGELDLVALPGVVLVALGRGCLDRPLGRVGAAVVGEQRLKFRLQPLRHTRQELIATRAEGLCNELVVEAGAVWRHAGRLLFHLRLQVELHLAVVVLDLEVLALLGALLQHASELAHGVADLLRLLGDGIDQLDAGSAAGDEVPLGSVGLDAGHYIAPAAPENTDPKKAIGAAALDALALARAPACW